MRIALGVEYEGGLFHGWQSQKALRTVQGTLEQALSQVADHPVHIQCAGRTDTGVHALGQVIHFDTEVRRTSRAWVYGGNANCPKDVSVRWAKFVDDTFHARFSAEARHYRYLIYNHPVRPSVFQKHMTWQYRPLDHKRMQEGGEYLLGEHDFSAFRAMGCQSKTPFRRLTHFRVTRQGDVIAIDVKANAFLHHMVRNIVGVLVDVGSGRREPSWVESVLHSKDRTVGGVTAPPYGLYFVGVDYPAQFQLPVTESDPFILAEKR